MTYQKPKTRSLALEIVQSHFPQVTKVVDATEDLPFTVTPKQAKDGKPLSHVDCPAARALSQMPKIDGAIISKRSGYTVSGTTAVRYRVPESLTREETAKDRGGSFQPGDYKLKAPGKGERLEDRYTGKTHNPSKRRRPSFTPHITENMRTSLGMRLHIS